MSYYTKARWIVVVLFCIACLATLNYNGPFFDESIYITAGIRTFEGNGLSDGYLTWFAGTLLWPAMAAVGYQVAGIFGTRAIAVILGTISLGAVGRATTNLFGERAGFWATLALALNGAFIALTRLGVYDLPALAGIAISFWAITELARQDHRRWLLVAAAAWAIAVLAKYPVGLMILPLLGLLLLLRDGKATTDAMIFLFVAAAIGLAIYTPLRSQIGGFFDWRLQNRPSFGVPLKVITYAIVYLSVAPTLLGLIGWSLAVDKRKVATLLLGCAFLWPVYHLVAEDPVGTNKHLVFGFLFVYPLVGLTLSRLWDLPSRLALGKIATVAVVIALSGIGIVQANQGDHSWPDLRTPAYVLAKYVQPGDELLINEAWPLTMHLYTNGQISSPWDVYDEYRLTHEDTAPDVCDYDWVVDTQGSYSWPSEIAEALDRCPDYQEFMSDSSTVVNLGSDLSYVSYTVQTIIWKNTSEGP